MIFFIVFIFAIFFAYKESKIPAIAHHRRKVYSGAKILWGIMFLLCALRSVNVGIDTSHYYNSFNSGIFRFVEFGYWSIRNISLWLGNSFQIFLILFASASLIPLYQLLKRESSNISFSLLIYLSFSNFFYPEVFNVIRATAAIAFFVLALSYWESRKYKISLFLFVISCLFHVSSIVACFITLLTFFIQQFPKKITYAVIIFSVLFGIAFQTGFSRYVDSLSLWLANTTGDVVDYYNHHLINFGETKFNLIGTLTNMLPFTMFALLLYNKENSSNNFYKLFVIGTILSNIFISITLAYRITMFFTILLIIILPNTLKRLSGIARTAVNALIIFMLLWYIYKLSGGASDKMAGIIPYSFFFEL